MSPLCKSSRYLTTAILAVIAGAGVAQANPAAQFTGEFERPYGFGYGEENSAYDANTRDLNGNRVIIDGRIIVGDDLSNLSSSGVYGYRFQGSGATYGRSPNATVSGNQLNVITQGSNNTIVIDSTQINNGDQTVDLNGELDLDD